MGFIIAAGILALILCLRISIRLHAGDETVLTAGIGFIKIRLFPQKEKSLRLKDFQIKRFRARQEKLAAKDIKDTKKAQKKAPKSEKVKPAETDETEGAETVSMVNRLIQVVTILLKRFGRHLQIKLGEFVLVVATGDAASTAVLYGAVVAVVQNLYALLISNGNLRTTASSRFTVEPDFTAHDTVIRVDVTLSFRLWQLLDVGIHSLMAYLRGDGSKTETA